MLETELPNFKFYTDASGTVGFGGVFNDKWFAGTWPASHQNRLNIAVLELYPVYVALHLWTERFSNSVVEGYTDNKAVVEVIQRWYAKDKQLRQLLKPITMTCLLHNIRLSAQHIPGKDNIGPDLLSDAIRCWSDAKIRAHGRWNSDAYKRYVGDS
jgi:hypothetical protein